MNSSARWSSLQPPAPGIDDHSRLEALIDSVIEALSAGDKSALSSLWNQLEVELVAHLDVEDAQLHQLTRPLSDTEARGIACEHRYIRTRVKELRVGIERESVRPSAILTFMTELRAHARHEEALLQSRSCS